MSRCPEVAQDPCLPSAVAAAGPSPGLFGISPVPRFQLLGHVEGASQGHLGLCTMSGFARGASGKPGTEQAQSRRAGGQLAWAVGHDNAQCLCVLGRSPVICPHPHGSHGAQEAAGGDWVPKPWPFCPAQFTW